MARTLGILTASDHIRKGEHLGPEERQTSFGDMIDLAAATTEQFYAVALTIPLAALSFADQLSVFDAGGRLSINKRGSSCVHCESPCLRPSTG